MVKAYVMARLAPNAARDGYELREIGIYSESSPTMADGNVFALLYAAEGHSFDEAKMAARGIANFYGGRMLARLVADAR